MLTDRRTSPIYRPELLEQSGQKTVHVRHFSVSKHWNCLYKFSGFTINTYFICLYLFWRSNTISSSMSIYLYVSMSVYVFLPIWIFPLESFLSYTYFSLFTNSVILQFCLFYLSVCMFMWLFFSCDCVCLPPSIVSTHALLDPPASSALVSKQ